MTADQFPTLDRRPVSRRRCGSVRSLPEHGQQRKNISQSVRILQLKWQHSRCVNSCTNDALFISQFMSCRLRCRLSTLLRGEYGAYYLTCSGTLWLLLLLLCCLVRNKLIDWLYETTNLSCRKQASRTGYKVNETINQYIEFNVAAHVNDDERRRHKMSITV